MRKRYLLIATIIFLLLGSIIVYLKANPPLSALGVSYYADDETKRVIQLVNSGLVNIKLNTVLVNGNDKSKVELGVTRSNHMVMGGGLDEDPTITFHAINKFPIKPVLSPEEFMEKVNQGELQSIKQYGIRILGLEEPKVVTIKYTYLGFPLSLEVDVVREK